jgi:hypothetical protein
MSDHAPDYAFQGGRYDEAAAKLEAGLKSQEPDGRDILLYLLDLALAQHSAGKYDESIKTFLRADKMAEIKDYTSLAHEAATLLVSENTKDYKAEDFENVLISTYLAMNYALIGKSEDAIVEAKRVNRKLHLMVTDGQRKYKQNAFARYLSAMLYEGDGNYNDAYVDYKEAHKLAPSFPGLGLDLWRCAYALREPDEMEQWDEEYHLTKEDHAQAKGAMPETGLGEIIVLYENGISPVKRPNPYFSSLPKFYPRYNPIYSAEVRIDGQPRARTTPLDDIESTAIENLDEKYGGLIAKKIAGVAAKEVVGYEIGKQTNSPLLGFLAKLALYASDQADLRSWNLLPKDLQIARIVVAPGTYGVDVIPIGPARAMLSKTVAVAKGKKIFVDFRYMPLARYW